MRWAAVLMSVAACNGLFGIKDTREIDATIPFFDAPTDAPFGCPGIGSNLAMSGNLHEEFQEECLDYHITPSGLAAGMCYVGRDGSAATTYVMATGTVGGGPLVASDSLPDRYTPLSSPAAYDQYDILMPSPDGMRMYSQLTHYDYGTATTTYSINLFTRQANGSWALTHTIVTPSLGFFSTVFHGPTGDRFLRFDAQTGMINEWAEDGSGSWTIGSDHRLADLGIVVPGQFSLTSDGLRMTFQATRTGDTTQQPLYTDRASLADWFRPVSPLPGAPYESAIQLTDDCARLYATGLGAVFSMQQR